MRLSRAISVSSHNKYKTNVSRNKCFSRCIMGDFTADVVLDPFFGSGTTGIVAKRLHRRFIGIELSGDFCDMADSRLAREAAGPTLI